MSASSHPNGTYPPASRANSAYVSDSKADLVSMELEQGNRVNINEGQPIIPQHGIFNTITQKAEVILNKISNNINKTHTGLISVLQGFQKCIT